MDSQPCGFLIVHKPAGPSSAAVVSRVRRLTGMRRVGHGGTLDPSATGVLVLGVGPATVLFPYLLQEKTYIANLRLGVITDTLDSEGRIQEIRPVPEFSHQQLEALAGGFVGSIWQTPPLYSALHYRGERLYQLARRGEKPPLPSRRVMIYQLQLLAHDSAGLQLKIVCSGGTYIRSLAADIGQRLGCGAHLHALIRAHSGGFSLDQAQSLEALEALPDWKDALVSPIQAVRHLPFLKVGGEMQIRVRHGGRIPVPPGSDWKDGQAGSVVDFESRLLAIAVRQNQELAMVKVLACA